MLILVGISITIAIKGNLFGITKEAAKQTTIEAYRENLEAIRVNAMMEQIKNELTTVEFMDKVEEGIRANSVFNGGKIKKTNTSVKVITKEGYLFKITESKVVYMGMADEQGKLTMDLSDKNTKFILDPEGWTKGNVKVSIKITVDAEELGAVLQYSLDGGNTWQEYKEQITVAEYGKVIKARLWNEDEGEEGTYAEKKISNIDRLNPKQFVPIGTSTSTTITLTGSTTDNEETESGSSGIKAYYYSIDNGATWLPENGTKEESYTFGNLPAATTYKTLKMKAVDYVGNETVTEAITVETRGLKVGDYVNYIPQNEIKNCKIDGKYSGYTSDQTINIETLKWRILNINDDETIDLISDNSTKNTVYLQGALGYNNGVYLLNNLCSTLYSNSKYGATARSINIEDIQDKMDLSVWDYHNFTHSTNGYTYGSTIAITQGYYPYQWSQHKQGKTKIDGALIAGTLGNSEQTELTTKTYVQASESITAENVNWNKENMSGRNFKKVATDNSENDGNMYYNLFAGKDFEYWLASRRNSINDNGAYFGIARFKDGSATGCTMFGSLWRSRIL